MTPLQNLIGAIDAEMAGLTRPGTVCDNFTMVDGRCWHCNETEFAHDEQRLCRILAAARQQLSLFNELLTHIDGLAHISSRLAINIERMHEEFQRLTPHREELARRLSKAWDLQVKAGDALKVK